MKQIRSVAVFALILLCPAIALAQTTPGSLTPVTQVEVDAAAMSEKDPRNTDYRLSTVQAGR
jgi:hypothetical protein